MNVPDFIEKYPQFWAIESPVKRQWQEISTQAKRHTKRNNKDYLFEKSRPNEDETIKDYRKDNVRNLTSAPVKILTNKLARIAKDSNISIDAANIDDRTKAFINSSDFEGMQIYEYIYFCIVATALEDPNACWIALPYWVQNGEIVSPYLFKPNNEFPEVRSMIIPSDDILFAEGELFAWIGGQKYLKVGNSNKKVDFYYLSDKEYIYRYYPKVSKEKNSTKIFYELELWYKHDYGKSLYNPLPGYIETDINDPNIKFRSSFIGAYFEYADEFDTAFSDNQGVRRLHNHPTLILDEMPCPNPACKGGRVISQELDENGKRKTKQCGVCNGGGKLTDVGPFKVLFRSSTGIDKSSNSKGAEYLVPPIANLQYSYEVAFDLEKRGRRAIAIDLLGDETESGIAKEYRLQSEQDFLNAFGIGLKGCVERFCGMVESYFVMNISDRVGVTLNLPKSYDIKTPAMLKEEASNSVGAERHIALMEYYEKLYKHNPEKLRVLQLAHQYSPILSLSNEDVEKKLALGVYQANDIIKRDFAVMAIEHIAKTIDIINAEPQTIFERVDDYIQPYLTPDAIPIIEQ